MKTTYRIELVDGQTLAPAHSQDAAAEAIRRHYGWSDVVLSDSYQDDDGTAWSAYSTQEACDADDTGAYAPRITEIDEEDDATDGDPDEIVTVETMPDCHRASHRAANNWGVYPMNGAEREEMSRADADEVIAADPDGYAHIV